jgi:hypothetical protein
MKPTDFVKLVDSMSYKPGWDLHAEEGAYYGYPGMVRLTTSHNEPDPLTREVGPIINEQTIGPGVLEGMDRASVIEWVRVFLLGAETHELNEHLKVGGVHVTDPHPELRPQTLTVAQAAERYGRP